VVVVELVLVVGVVVVITTTITTTTITTTSIAEAEEAIGEVEAVDVVIGEEEVSEVVVASEVDEEEEEETGTTITATTVMPTTPTTTTTTITGTTTIAIRTTAKSPTTTTTTIITTTTTTTIATRTERDQVRYFLLLQSLLHCVLCFLLISFSKATTHREEVDIIEVVASEAVSEEDAVEVVTIGKESATTVGYSSLLSRLLSALPFSSFLTSSLSVWSVPEFRAPKDDAPYADDDSSSEEEEDENGDLLTPAIENQFFRVLPLIRYLAVDKALPHSIIHSHSPLHRLEIKTLRSTTRANTSSKTSQKRFQKRYDQHYRYRHLPYNNTTMYRLS